MVPQCNSRVIVDGLNTDWKRRIAPAFPSELSIYFGALLNSFVFVVGDDHFLLLFRCVELDNAEVFCLWKCMDFGVFHMIFELVLHFNNGVVFQIDNLDPLIITM